MRINSNSFVNFMFHPFHYQHRTSKILALIGTVALGCLTLGVLHLASAVVWRDKVFTKIQKDDKITAATENILPPLRAETSPEKTVEEQSSTQPSIVSKEFVEEFLSKIPSRKKFAEHTTKKDENPYVFVVPIEKRIAAILEQPIPEGDEKPKKEILEKQHTLLQQALACEKKAEKYHLAVTKHRIHYLEPEELLESIEASKKSILLYLEAAELGNAIAMDKLALVIEKRIGVSVFFPASIPGDLHQKAIEILQKAVTQEDPEAQNYFGKMLYQGLYIPRDRERATQLFQCAADKGNLESVITLAEAYRWGRIVAKDLQKAIELYQLAADKGDDKAMVILSDLFDEGTEAPKDEKRSLQLLQDAAAKGNHEALFGLGWMYEEGLLGPRDYSMAAKMYQRAIENGSSEAMNSLGKMYEQGRGVPQDFIQAAMLYKMALNEDALERLKEKVTGRPRRVVSSPSSS